VLNHELYGFYGVSVWVANIAFPRELLESTKLVKFERYAEFTVADLTECGRVRLLPPDQRPGRCAARTSGQAASAVSLITRSRDPATSHFPPRCVGK
jgi:hypothetical protein